MQAVPPAPPTPLLVLDQVRAYGAPGFELGPLSLSVMRAERVALLGETGAGKSLLLRCIAELHSVVAGRLRVADNGQSADAQRDCQSRIGLAFQRDALLAEANALENIALAARARGLRDADARAWALLSQMGLETSAHKLPAELSGGMRRRVGLARALVSEPTLLLCDDTTAGLDPATEAEIMSQIFDYVERSQAALLFATHSLDGVVRYVDRVAILQRGKLGFVGTPSQLGESAEWSAFAPHSLESVHGG